MPLKYIFNISSSLNQERNVALLKAWEKMYSITKTGWDIIKYMELYH